ERGANQYHRNRGRTRPHQCRKRPCCPENESGAAALVVSTRLVDRIASPGLVRRRRRRLPGCSHGRRQWQPQGGCVVRSAGRSGPEVQHGGRRSSGHLRLMVADLSGLLWRRSRTRRTTSRKKNIGAPTAAKARNQLDLPKSAKIGTI